MAFGISFFVMEIFTFLYYANEKSDDAIGGSTKTVQHSITNISRSITPAFSVTCIGDIFVHLSTCHLSTGYVTWPTSKC